MNNYIKLMLAMLLIVANRCYSDQDCLDNSWHLAKANDHKEFHPVSCNCPCRTQKILPKRGQCITCLHYRYPRPFLIIKSTDSMGSQRCKSEPEELG